MVLVVLVIKYSAFRCVITTLTCPNNLCLGCENEVFWKQVLCFVVSVQLSNSFLIIIVQNFPKIVAFFVFCIFQKFSHPLFAFVAIHHSRSGMSRGAFSGGRDGDTLNTIEETAPNPIFLEWQENVS